MDDQTDPECGCAEEFAEALKVVVDLNPYNNGQTSANCFRGFNKAFPNATALHLRAALWQVQDVNPYNSFVGFAYDGIALRKAEYITKSFRFKVARSRNVPMLTRLFYKSHPQTKPRTLPNPNNRARVTRHSSPWRTPALGGGRAARAGGGGQERARLVGRVRAGDDGCAAPPQRAQRGAQARNSFEMLGEDYEDDVADVAKLDSTKLNCPINRRFPGEAELLAQLAQ
jgi:hypothetical protein